MEFAGVIWFGNICIDGFSGIFNACNYLGNKPAEELLKLKPSYCFSVHRQTKFAAVVQHEENIPITKFLALDKCLPSYNFIQVIEIESDARPHEIHYGEEWIAITQE